ncbi:MAG TPA: NAD(P)H-dependent oxidoreductase [Candidatus Paceibacterota bacterium]|nr:NAD(P)H-dependent oxidoreductase [Candidatus Paceibacterota bacterium]
MESSSVLLISGSNRTGSFTTAIAHALDALVPDGLTLVHADISDLPLFDQDLEADPPAAVTRLKEAIRAADGIIIATPEHNRSIPALLKNALDWASRPYGDNAWSGKVMLPIGVTTGRIGAALAVAHLRQIGLYLGMRVLGQPELYLAGVRELIAEDGSIADSSTRELLAGALASFGGTIREARAAAHETGGHAAAALR